jgi:hypothetical protein
MVSVSKILDVKVVSIRFLQRWTVYKKKKSDQAAAGTVAMFFTAVNSAVVQKCGIKFNRKTTEFRDFWPDGYTTDRREKLCVRKWFAAQGLSCWCIYP